MKCKDCTIDCRFRTSDGEKECEYQSHTIQITDEWDAEKKELKKIEQKPAWSKEDEKMLNDAIGAVSIADYYTYDDKQEIENWLKSLKERYSWKPSDEQMEAIRIAAEVGTANNSWAMCILKGMYQDLKKLKGE